MQVKPAAMVAGLLLLLLSGGAHAEDLHGFEDPADQERFRALSWELRCPKCQNQNLADSNAPVAEDLRTEVIRMMREGNSDEEIRDFMVARYGEFVLYRPRMTAQTIALWFAPAILLVLGALVILRIARRRRESAQAGDQLSAEEQERLNQLLQKTRDAS